MATSPSPGRFQYHLRTLLIFVTIMAALAKVFTLLPADNSEFDQLKPPQSNIIFETYRPDRLSSANDLANPFASERPESATQSKARSSS